MLIYIRPQFPERPHRISVTGFMVCTTGNQVRCAVNYMGPEIMVRVLHVINQIIWITVVFKLRCQYITAIRRTAEMQNVYPWWDVGRIHKAARPQQPLGRLDLMLIFTVGSSFGTGIFENHPTTLYEPVGEAI